MSQEDTTTLDLLGVSVYYLETTFMEEVREAGYNEHSKIYNLENLQNQTEMGVIRQKGAQVTCPGDGRLGAAYVHCLSGNDNVGLADFMLSYSWGYEIGDIISCLVDFCVLNDRDPRRTYFWICCLCVNQHRVVELAEEEEEEEEVKPTDTPKTSTKTLDFFAEFGTRVIGIGHVVAILAPWNNPLYLNRVWCIFELYTAHQKGCDFTILVPPAQKASVEEDVFGDTRSIDALYEMLARIKVQDAKASVEADRLAILEMIRDDPGYQTFNYLVNKLLRRWVRYTVLEVMKRRKRESEFEGDRGLSYAASCNFAGVLLSRHREYKAALRLFRKAMAIRENVWGTDHPDTMEIYDNVNETLQAKERDTGRFPKD